MTRLEKKLILIGITTIITIIIVIMGYSFLKGNNPLKKDRYFYVIYPDIQGLSETAPVFLSGKTIGQVKKVRFYKPDTDLIIITLLIENKIKIPSHSVAKIISTDVLGTKAIRLIPNYASHSWAKPGDTLIPQIEPTMEQLVLQQLQPIQQAVVNLNKVLIGINAILNPQTIDQLHSSFAHLEHSLVVLDTTLHGYRFQNSLTNLQSFTRDLKNQEDTINSILSQTNQTVTQINQANLKRTIEQTDSMITAINVIIRQIQNGQGTLGKLYAQKELYDKLDSITYKINYLLDEILRNPKHYIKVSVF